MDIVSLRKEWSSENYLNTNNVEEELSRTYALHGKYLTLLSEEVIKYKALLREKEKINNDYRDFYLG